MSRRKFRDRVSFFLYVAVAVVSVCICCLVTVANPSAFVKAFTTSNYVESLRDDVSLYVSDMCKKNNVPDDFVGDVVKYDDMYYLETAYVSGQLGASKQYNENAFNSMLAEYKVEMQNEIKKELSARNIKLTKSSENNLALFCDDIASYIESRISFKYMNNVRNGVKIIRIISYILIAVFGISGIALAVWLSVKGGKSYKVLRSTAGCFLGASLINVITAISIGIVNATKELVIYPLYIAQAFVDYTEVTAITFASCSAIMFFIFLVMLVFGWKLKRSEME